MKTNSSCILRTTLPITLYDHMVVQTEDDHFVTCGGHTGVQPEASNQCFVYDPVSDQWTQMPNLPVGVRNGVMLSANDKIYVIGGWINAPSDKFFAFENGAWAECPPLLVTRFSPCGVNYKGNLVITGGSAQNGDRTQDLALVESFNSQSNIWEPLLEMNLGRRHHACALVGQHNLIVAGGSGAFENVQTSVEMLDLSNNNSPWQVLGSLQKARCCWPQMGLVGQVLTIIGGERVASVAVEEFDGGQWKVRADDGCLRLKRAQDRAVFWKLNNNDNVFGDCMDVK